MSPKALHSLSFRLTLWYIVILVGIIVLAGFFLYQEFKDGLVADLDAKLLEIANDVNEYWGRSRGVSWLDAVRRTEEEFSAVAPFIQVVELTEKDKDRLAEVFAPERAGAGLFTLEPRTYYKADRADIDELVYDTIERRGLSDHPLRIILFPVRGPYIVQVGLSLGLLDADLRRLLLILGIAGGLVMLLAALGGNFIIRKALRPVRSVADTARRISTEDLSLRIEARKRRDEIGELVDTFNDMIARLEKSVHKIKQFSGDVSHELRTPLTIIRGEVEVLLRKERTPEEYRRILHSALEETHHLERIIDDLLFLSRLEAVSGAGLHKPVALDEVLLRAVESRESSAAEKRLELRIGKMDSAEAPGDERLLERMIANLLDNAIRYTPAGGEVEVALERRGGASVLSVRDTGIGIPEESIPLVFDRFYVVDKSRSKETGGSGLGLSIVKRVADSHGARIEIDSEVGKGTLFRIVFGA